MPTPGARTTASHFYEFADPRLAVYPLQPNFCSFILLSIDPWFCYTHGIETDPIRSGPDFDNLKLALWSMEIKVM